MTPLDGNIAAGLLYEAFGVEMTDIAGSCGACGRTRRLGEWEAYRGAGTVLRCPGCGSVGLVLVERDDRVVSHVVGMPDLQRPGQPS